jgi:hypothetical protein
VSFEISQVKLCRGNFLFRLACALLLTAAPAFPVEAATVSVQPVSQSPYQLRKFDREKVKAYRQNDDYAYDRAAGSEAPNLWERFRAWLIEKIFRPLLRDERLDYWRWGIYGICALIIGWAVLRMTGTGVRGLFFGKGKSNSFSYEESEANIHVIDFDKMIADAVDQGHYRRAVRLFYLKTLKQLSDRGLIDWRPDKTNHDYLREWKRRDIEPGFRQVTVLFEYICYGDFSIDLDRFQQAQKAFQDFEAQIRGIRQ